jgi:hypothetical protein
MNYKSQKASFYLKILFLFVPLDPDRRGFENRVGLQNKMTNILDGMGLQPHA